MQLNPIILTSYNYLINAADGRDLVYSYHAPYVNNYCPVY